MSFSVVSDVDADSLLDLFADCEKAIKVAEEKRDALIDHYLLKIEVAKDICQRETRDAQDIIAELTAQLKDYAETRITDKKRSVSLPNGTLSFRKQQPKFFFDGLVEAKADDERLVHFVKHNAHQFLKVKVDESVDWANFKRTLAINDNGDVYFAETGEFIDGLHAQFLPDKFTVKTA